MTGQKVIAVSLLSICVIALFLPFMKQEQKSFIKHEFLVCATAICVNDPTSKEQCLEFMQNVAHLTVEQADSSEAFRVRMKLTNKKCQ